MVVAGCLPAAAMCAASWAAGRAATRGSVGRKRCRSVDMAAQHGRVGAAGIEEQTMARRRLRGTSARLQERWRRPRGVETTLAAASRSASGYLGSVTK